MTHTVRGFSIDSEAVDVFLNSLAFFVIQLMLQLAAGAPGGLDKFACNAGDKGSIPGSGRSTGGGNGNPFQYSCLGNPMDRRA